ncbi:acylglycerol kinase, mitochondrial-like [Saccoglossus kowalevskii]
MSALLKPFRVVRTHWKKSTFFAIAATYGSYYFHDKYQSNLIRRELCEEAMKYGAETMTVTEKPRKVLVILNPAAKKGKARKLFQANAAPILHLAGISTEIFEYHQYLMTKCIMCINLAHTT